MYLLHWSVVNDMLLYYSCVGKIIFDSLVFSVYNVRVCLNFHACLLLQLIALFCAMGKVWRSNNVSNCPVIFCFAWKLAMLCVVIFVIVIQFCYVFFFQKWTLMENPALACVCWPLWPWLKWTVWNVCTELCFCAQHWHRKNRRDCNSLTRARLNLCAI